MQTSGLVLDVYDDHDGATLKALWPSREAVPDGIKQAHFAPADQRDRFPDDAFALVLLEDGRKLRKYACIDEGNTALSIAYFFQHGHKLPEEAQKVAAANLVTACGWYGLEVPELLEKVAVSDAFIQQVVANTAKRGGKGLARAGDFAANISGKAIARGNTARRLGEAGGVSAVEDPAWRHAIAGRTRYELAGHAAAQGIHEGTEQAAKRSLALKAVTGGLAAAGTVAGVHHLLKKKKNKDPDAKVAMGIGGLLNAATVVPGAAMGIKNNLATDKALRAQGAGIITPEMRAQAQGQKMADINGTPLAPNQPPGVLRVDPSKAVIPKTAHLRPYVDVTGKTASARPVEVEPALYAVPSQQLYPLDSYAQVKTASAYFDEYVHHMPPAMRREYAANLVKRAHALDIPVGEAAARYGADGFAPDDEIKAAFDLRRLEVHGDPELFKLLGEVEKVARHRIWQEGDKIASTQNPEEVVYLLAEFDKLAGLDRHYDRAIPDPYYSIYGSEKIASDEMWSDVIGNDYVNATDLKRLAAENVSRVIKRFGEDFQKEFLKDPVGIYKSLPVEQKKIVIHMAQSSAPGEPL